MAEKKINIPDGMWKSAYNATVMMGKSREECTTKVLEAALRWLDGELEKSDGQSPLIGGTYQDGWIGAWRHIRRMFLAPESEVPDAIRDCIIADDQPISRECHNARVLEAYRRGQKERP
jgi:ribosome modulation factor